MAYIKWFSELSINDVGLVGGKGASLGELYKAGFSIPPGFCVTAEAYKKVLEDSSLNEKIKEILDSVDVGDTENLNEKSKEIRELILNVKIAEDMKADILEAYENMNVDNEVFKNANKQVLDLISAGREDAFVAVRSSATAEDLPEASFAGQQETFLNVKGKEKLLDSIKKCWASLFTSRAIFYREKNNFDHMQVYLCVVVQKMINSETAGVMFSVNPATNNKNEILIEAGYGLGESVVSGAINPDLYIIDKESMGIKSKQIKKQTWMFVKDHTTGETVKKNVDGALQESQVISNEVIDVLAELAVKIEDYYKKPQDIEWAVENKNVFIVQSRPITTLGKEIEGKEVVGKVILSGLAASAGVATGKVRVIKDESEFSKLEKGDILVTPMTKPSMVPLMEKAAAIVTDEGGLTSHASIVSRELGIPCIVGSEKATRVLEDGLIVTVDATHGKVYLGEVEEIKEEVKEEVVLSEDIEVITKIKAIVDIPSVAEKAAETGADGVGLLRSEFLIAGSEVHPGKLVVEDREKLINELVDGLSVIAKAFSGKPVWYRTLDLRTDEYSGLKGGEDEPKEDNPMMGWHGIRRDLDQPELLKAQFEAIKRVHDGGLTNVGVMLPMITHVEQVKEAKKIMEEVGLSPLDEIEFGVMIETPASVGIIEDICKEGIDFVSFGTNDLTQFTLGLDRNNAKVQKLYDEMHPAVLRQISYVVSVCKRYNVETSICGQAGSKPKMAEFLVKIGIDSISANPDSVKKIKQVVYIAEKKLLLDSARRE